MFMKKNYLKLISPFLLATFFIIGCQKETQETKPEIDLQSSAKPKNECRLTSFDYYDGIADNHQIDYYTYKDGLVDEWRVWYGLVYKIEYHSDGKLKTARGYEGDDLVYTIQFVYENGRIVREFWYVGNTNVLDDDINYTYDRKGQIIKGESLMLGYYTENVYTPNGDLESWKFYDGVSPVVSGHYTYSNHYKSPFVGGTPGVDYNFPYSNSTFGQTKWWYSSEKIISYDEVGNPTVYYDQDPLQTQWQIGSNDNLEYVEYVDRLSGTHLSVGFEYENCRESGNSNSRIAPPSSGGIKKINPLSLIVHNPSKSIKTQIAELRQQLKK
jgi:hypothetical protein